MTSFRRFFLWYGLLTKRLIRRPAYLAVLLLIPLFAIAITIFSHESSGVLTVAIAMENPEDPASRSTVDRLLHDPSVMSFTLEESEEAAREAVRSGQADAAWIFPADLSDRLDRYARYASGGAIPVIESTDSVFLRLSREKLFMALYPEVSYRVFRSYLLNTLGAPEEPDAVLESYYNSGATTEEILDFSYADGTKVELEGSYVAAPLRGILALLLLLCGLASGMYCYREERDESFVWLSPRLRRFLPVLCHIVAMLPAAAAVLVALVLVGDFGVLWQEVLVMLLYLPVAALFCELIRCVCPREEQYGALIPILAVAVLVLSPIFLSMKAFLPMSRLLPTTYYLYASVSILSVKDLLLYGLVLIPLTLLASRLREYMLGKQSGKL